MKKILTKSVSVVLLLIIVLSTTMMQSVSAAPKLSKVRQVKATVNASKKTIKLSWKKVKGAKGYIIYKNTKKKFNKIKGVTVKKTTKTFKKLKVGKTYYFKIQAYKNAKKKSTYGVATTKKVVLKAKAYNEEMLEEEAVPDTTAPQETVPNVNTNEETVANLDELLGMSKKNIGATMTSPLTEDKYTLKFIDDFDGTTINQKNWSYFTRNYNAAEESVNRKENVIVENGILNIFGKKEKQQYTGDAESWETPKKSYFTGGAINSENKKEFKYGRLEIYCRIPYSYGMWPAFWTMGTQRGWPWGGEIDIMEFVGGVDQWNNYRDDEYHCGIHWADPNTPSSEAWGGSGHLSTGFGRNFEIPGGPSQGAKLHDKWRVCGLEWNEEMMYAYCDDERIGVINITKNSMREAFHQTHYMILNLVMGGSWAGTPDEEKGTVFPQNFQIDWVKVWQK